MKPTSCSDRASAFVQTALSDPLRGDSFYSPGFIPRNSSDRALTLFGQLPRTDRLGPLNECIGLFSSSRERIGDTAAEKPHGDAIFPALKTKKLYT